MMNEGLIATEVSSAGLECILNARKSLKDEKSLSIFFSALLR